MLYEVITAIFTEEAKVAQIPMLEITTVYNRQGFRFGAVCAMGVVFMLVRRTRRRD